MYTKNVNLPIPGGLAVPVRELNAGHRAAILEHFLLLEEEDRRLRFGTQTPNEVIEHYVENLNFDHDSVFAVFDADLKILGLAHLAYLPAQKNQALAAEFGVSVLEHARGHGVGTALLDRAATHSRNTRVETLYVHCLANNKSMMSLAQKAGMRVEFAYGDADAYLKLDPATSATLVTEVANAQWANFDYALKSNLKNANDAWQWFLSHGVAKV
ncbi:GNAT family N-acetyltransferase [Polynucleobacter sp. MWH-P3-07-1]|uniref:GNAT family N-acetyltransferase n=1 Tax=Polynucleobacter sp. MWH-P3-07-1 TaxID=1743173 RepID=UPI001BFDEC2B|nr:GNAT family N-acetyltransferase [Polynucleobacter sp. MWH-P3-07-1]QWD83545.1 GNAT family N-acetyltransferase [Polynucleobacter sp. MWH-P3-07-1]